MQVSPFPAKPGNDAVPSRSEDSAPASHSAICDVDAADVLESSHDRPPLATDAHAARIRRWVIYGLGTLLLLINAYVGTYAYVVVQALLWTQTSLQRGPVVMLFLVVVLNLLAARFARRFALTRAELMVLYTMLAVGTCAAGYGFVQILINQMSAPFYEDYATGSSKFKDYIQPYIPEWLAPRDPKVINPFFRGNSTLWDATHLRGWAVPVLAWTFFIFCIFWTLLCGITLFRRQWVEEERLTFPLVLLPLEMTCTDETGGTPFWRNKWMWMGFVVAGLLESLNFLNFLIPAVPSVALKPGMGSNELQNFFTSRPWNAVGRLSMAFYPFAIGIGYLLALDVSFSCWFLYLMVKVSQILCSTLGLSEGGAGSLANRMPYIREQGVGAFVGIAVFSAWMARRALADAWRQAVHPTGRDRDELMSFRLAIFGGMVGLFGMIGFLMTAGLPLAVSMVWVFIYVCFSLTLARIVSEAGAGWAWAPFWSASTFVGDVSGYNNLTPQQTALLLGYTSWTSDMRDNPMPQYAQGARIAPGAGFSPRSLLAPLIFAAVLGILAAFWAHLDAYYTFGAATAKVRPALANGATGASRQAVSMILAERLPDTAGLTAAGVGMAIAIGLSLARQAFTWWSLHPLGYALATTNSMEYMWCPFLIAWLAKLITLRYGGIKAYRAALPFFLGLILGDYVVPTAWGLFGMATGYQQYMAFPH
ncbi:MAG: hypothetical protein OHK0029_28480 [Armatimonadaceae bacterium]